MIIFYHDFSDKVMSNVASELNNTYEIGLMLFSQHIFSFEVTAFILLVAIIAAIAINLTLRERSLRQDPGKQILENKNFIYIPNTFIKNVKRKKLYELITDSKKKTNLRFNKVIISTGTVGSTILADRILNFSEKYRLPGVGLKFMFHFQF